MTALVLRIAASGLCALASGCAERPHASDSLSVPALAAAPARFDQHPVTVRGVAHFTSHGIWLVPRCASADDISRVVILQRPDITAMIDDDAFEHMVELTGTFHVWVENGVQSYHKLSDAKYVGRIAESACPE